MDLSIRLEIADLPKLKIAELRARYLALFGDPTNACNKVWVIRRIAWRLQAQAEGGLSDRTQQREAELAQEADLRIIPPNTTSPASPDIPAPYQPMPSWDRRLPPPGTVLTRTYKGNRLHVLILADGFEFAGERFPRGGLDQTQLLPALSDAGASLA